MKVIQFKDTDGSIYRYPLSWLAVQIVRPPAVGKKKLPCKIVLGFAEPFNTTVTSSATVARIRFELESWFSTIDEALAAVTVVDLLEPRI